MTDPLSIAASAAGLLSLGLQVAEYLYNYYAAYRDRDDDLAKTANRLHDLIHTLQNIDDTVRRRTWQSDEQAILRNIETHISRCEDVINDLQDEVRKFQNDTAGSSRNTARPTDNVVKAVKAAGRRAAYPLRRSTLEKLNEDIGELRDNLSTVLQALQLKQSQDTHDEVGEIKKLVENAQALSLKAAVREWLNAPDATTNYNSACSKRHAGTGQWFVKGGAFRTWLEADNSYLWLYGFAGCGKSILCSTAIQHTFRHQQSQTETAVAFFFFTFNDESKQDISALLRALLLQLAGQVPGVGTDLTRLKASCNDGSPPVSTMMDYLQRAILRCPDVYILLDALDECPVDKSRAEVLSAIETMRKWLLPGLHILVTSRDELDIRNSLVVEKKYTIALKNDEISKDILNYVSYQVDHDRQLQRWGDHREEIKKHLAERADGVFRWVECQLGPLRSCPQSPRHLRRCLDSLPKSLDATYERMLCEIEEGSKEEAHRILTLLCFSYRPLTVAEVIDALALDIFDQECYDDDRKLKYPEDLLRICPGLIDIDSYEDVSPDKHDEDRVVRIAHFSVQEYLTSDRITRGPAASFGTSKMKGHFEISKTCLLYLCDEHLTSQELDQLEFDRAYPLAMYAAEFWHRHFAEDINKGAADLMTLALRLLLNKDSLEIWRALYDVDRERTRPSYHGEIEPRSPVYDAAVLGLSTVVSEILTISPEDVNAQGGIYGTALQAGSYLGNQQVVQVLLDRGADVNICMGQYGNALYAASLFGNEHVVQILLDRNADVNARGGLHSTALHAASASGHQQVVSMLLDHGANIEARGGIYGTVLQAASVSGHVLVAELLLDRGADVNASAGDFGNALYVASISGHERVVKLLLERGADANVQGGPRGTALQAAITSGHKRVVALLLDPSADVESWKESLQ